jgi:hypothetical protein
LILLFLPHFLDAPAAASKANGCFMGGTPCFWRGTGKAEDAKLPDASKGQANVTGSGSAAQAICDARARCRCEIEAEWREMIVRGCELRSEVESGRHK